LFGNANNWRYFSYNEQVRARRISHLIDLRNHGESDHHDSMTYPELAEDVIRHMIKKGIKKFTLLGHSMGAKVAMNMATMVPDMLDGVMIVDSAPKDHSNDLAIYKTSKDVIDKLSDYDITDKTRKEVMDDFKDMFNGSVANLLGTNLTYVNNDSDIVTWRVNLDAIKKNYNNIIKWENRGTPYKGPLKILIGEKSHIFPISVFKPVFPDIVDEDIVIIKDAGNFINLGHWLHSDKPRETIIEITKFLDKIDNKI
jgi:pimeloyl-ACP methyl ester carboxylesterase